MTNVEFLILLAVVPTVFIGGPWLFVVSVVAITNPTLTTWQAFAEAKRRLGVMFDKVAAGFLLLCVFLLACCFLIAIAVDHGWLKIAKLDGF